MSGHGKPALGQGFLDAQPFDLPVEALWQFTQPVHPAEIGGEFLDGRSGREFRPAAAAPPPHPGRYFQRAPEKHPQDRTSLGGKVLRIDAKTGNALPDNPFAKSANPNEQRVFTYGHRNV